MDKEMLQTEVELKKAEVHSGGTGVAGRAMVYNARLALVVWCLVIIGGAAFKPIYSDTFHRVGPMQAGSSAEAKLCLFQCGRENNCIEVYLENTAAGETCHTRDKNGAIPAGILMWKREIADDCPEPFFKIANFSDGCYLYADNPPTSPVYKQAELKARCQQRHPDAHLVELETNEERWALYRHIISMVGPYTIFTFRLGGESIGGDWIWHHSQVNHTEVEWWLTPYDHSEDVAYISMAISMGMTYLKSDLPEDPANSFMCEFYP